MTTTAAPTGNLEITVSRAELLRELTAAQSVVERKTTIPILSNFLFEAADDTLTITATDLDQSIRTSCAAKVKKPGACTIPARKLYDYIKLLPEGDISIKLMDNHWVQIRAGRSNTKMVGMARANFPQVPEFPGVRRVQDLRRPRCSNMISKTIFAISNEEIALHAERRAAGAEGGVDGDGRDRRPPPGAHREDGRDAGRHLRREEDADPAQGAGGAAVACSNSTDAETLEFADDEQTLFFRVGGRVLTSRKLTGQFPNYEAVLPRDNNKFVIVRSRGPDGLASSASRSLRTSARARSRFAWSRTSSSCRPRPPTPASRKTSIETPYNYDPLVVGFNSQYLIDFLKAIGNDRRSAAGVQGRAVRRPDAAGRRQRGCASTATS